MSFFKDIKDDLEQAVSDIETTGKGEDEETVDDLFSAAEQTDASDVDPELLENLMEEEEESAKPDGTVKGDVKPADEPPKEPVKRPMRESTEEDKDAVTVITKGTTINGSIISDCSLDVMGTINGDIECLGKLTISGKVTGNSTASEVYVNTNRLEGSINSEGAVKIGLGTIVIGDVSATSAVFAGAVKGEIDVKGPVVLDSTAIIKGNIKAKSVQMNNGAVMEGFCSLSYADLEIDTIFE